MSHTNPLPLSLSQMIQKMKLPGHEGKTTVVVGIITNNMCVQEVTNLKVCALCVSSHAQEPHPQGRGQDPNHLALDAPKGCGTILLSGPCKGRGVQTFWQGS